MNTKTAELENRLIRFSIVISEVVESLPNTKLSQIIGNQLIRSGISPALNYGEAQVAESRADFIHKLKVCLKEFKETQINLRIIAEKGVYSDAFQLSNCIMECGELIAIFLKSIDTAKKT